MVVVFEKVAKLDHFYLKKHALAFVPGKYFHLCLKFEIMAGTSSSKAPFWLLALPTDIKVPLKKSCQGGTLSVFCY